MAYFDFKAQGGGAKAYYLGTLESEATLDVSAKYENYANLTADNFLIVPQTAGADVTASNYNDVDVSGWREFRTDNNAANYIQPAVTYNPSTGQLSFTCSLQIEGWSYGSNSWGDKWCWTYPRKTIGITSKVYLVTEIEEL